MVMCEFPQVFGSLPECEADTTAVPAAFWGLRPAWHIDLADESVLPYCVMDFTLPGVKS